MHTRVHVGVRGQLAGLSFLPPPCGSRSWTGCIFTHLAFRGPWVQLPSNFFLWILWVEKHLIVGPGESLQSGCAACTPGLWLPGLSKEVIAFGGLMRSGVWGLGSNTFWHYLLLASGSFSFYDCSSCWSLCKTFELESTNWWESSFYLSICC